MFGRKAKLGWQGEQYEITVTMELVEDLDEKVNVLATAIELGKGDIPKITLVAKLYSTLLYHAGVNVSKEDVYESIMSAPAESAELVAAARHAIDLCFPRIDEGIKGSKKK